MMTPIPYASIHPSKKREVQVILRYTLIMKLYILGNGFDLAHKLKTSYDAYRSFIKDNLKNHPDWHIILDYYPENHKFWCDAEKHVCAIDYKNFVNLKKIWNMTFLDDLLSKIHQSFELFILSAESEISKKQPIFELDTKSIFMTFNYTSVLENLYKVDKKDVMHLHNKAEDAAMKQYFGIAANDCILGHSTRPNEYVFYADSIVGEDHDYMVFMRKTRKDTEKVIKENNLMFKLTMLQAQNLISEVVIFGFSFSPADKEYINFVQMFLEPSKIRYKAYYHVEQGETEEGAKNRIINNMIASACNPYDFELINSDNIKKL